MSPRWILLHQLMLLPSQRDGDVNSISRAAIEMASAANGNDNARMPAAQSQDGVTSTSHNYEEIGSLAAQRRSVGSIALCQVMQLTRSYADRQQRPAQEDFCYAARYDGQFC